MHLPGFDPSLQGDGLPSSAGDRETDLLTLLPFEKTRRSIMALGTPLQGVGDASPDDTRPAPPIEDFAEGGDEFDDFEGSLDVEGSSESEGKLTREDGKEGDASEDEEEDEEVSQPPESAPPEIAAIQREHPPPPPPCFCCVEVV